MNEKENEKQGMFEFFHDFKVDVMLVLPEMAREFLTHSTYNRPISKKRISYYVDKMQRGEWIQGQAEIGFDKNGRLINGHHVLNSIITSGIPQICKVVHGYEPNAVDNFDEKISSRTSMDTISFMLDGKHVKNANDAMYIANKVILWGSGKKTEYVERAHFAIDNMEKIQAAFYHPSVFVRKDNCFHGYYDFYTAGYFIIDAGNSAKNWERFLDILFDNGESGKKAPTVALARYLRTGKASSPNRRDITIAVILAWNAWVLGKEISRLNNEISKYDKALPKPCVKGE